MEIYYIYSVPGVALEVALTCITIPLKGRENLPRESTGEGRNNVNVRVYDRAMLVVCDGVVFYRRTLG